MDYSEKYYVACCDEDVESCLDEYVVAFFDKNNKDDFDVDFLFEHPLEYTIGETLDGQCLVHHGYMKNIGWSETYVHFYNYHTYKNMMIYQDHLNYGRETVWSATYIQFYHHHHNFIQH